MADENPLLTADAPTAAPRGRKEAPAAAEGNPLLSADTKAPKEPGQEDVGYAEDIGRTLVSKGTRGVAALPGMFGDIPALFGADKYRPPTTEEYIEKLSSISPSFREALSYEPKTAAARYAGSAAEFLPSAALALVPGGQGPALSRLGMGAVGAIGSGIGSQAVEDIIHKSGSPLAGTPYEGAGKLVGAVAGGMAAPGAVGKVAGLFKGAETIAAERLATQLAKDIASRTSKAGESAIAGGELAPAAAAGPETQKLLKGSAGRSSEEAVGGFNAATENFKEQAAPRVQAVIDDIFKRPVNAFDEMDAVSQRVKDLNNVNYTRVMALPEAQSITNPALDKITSRIPKSTVDDMLEQFKIDGIDPASMGFRPVLDRAGNVKTHQLPSQGVSLSAWDEIKRGIDTSINKLYDPITKAPKPGSESQVRSLMGLKSDLIGILDTAVKDYKGIRFDASELYGARNAIEAGYKYFGDVKAKNMNNIHKLVNQKLSPSQKEDFAYGYAAALKDQLTKFSDDPKKVLGVYGGPSGQFNIDKMRFALGDANANKLLGNVNAEYLNSTIKTLASGGIGAGIPGASFKGALGAVAGELALTGENILQAMSFSMAPTAIAGAILAGTGKALYTARERKIAEQVLRLASDPSQSERLGKLIADNKDARSFLSKLYNTAKNVPPVAATTQESQNEVASRAGRKSGGRVSHETMADSLVRAAEVAKKNIGKQTEVILNKPDETVVRALKIANQNLEG
jgi:hypothetical protein